MHASRWGELEYVAATACLSLTFCRCVRLLLSRGCTVETRDRFGWSALMLAARWNQVPPPPRFGHERRPHARDAQIEVVQELLSYSPPMECRDRVEGRTALMWASAMCVTASTPHFPHMPPPYPSTTQGARRRGADAALRGCRCHHARHTGQGSLGPGEQRQGERVWSHSPHKHHTGQVEALVRDYMESLPASDTGEESETDSDASDES